MLSLLISYFINLVFTRVTHLDFIYSLYLILIKAFFNNDVVLFKSVFLN